MTGWLFRVARWLADGEPCIVEGCPRAASKADGACYRHRVNHLGQVSVVSKDGMTAQAVAGARLSRGRVRRVRPAR